MPVLNFSVDKLKVEILPSRAAMGAAAGAAIADEIRGLAKDEINIIFAAAPSQNEVLEALLSYKDIDWSRVNAFHMDEYIGLAADAPQGFGNFLRRHIFDKVPFKSVNYLNGNNPDLQGECDRYSALLKEHPADIVCMGIGENAHIAFNDPGEADFNDSRLVKVVTLDEVCRMQQVNDGCFKTIGDVPKQALSLTVPALMAGGYIACSVPAKTKAQAVKNTLECEISPMIPASVLRTHNNATLYCDNDSSALIKEGK